MSLGPSRPDAALRDIALALGHAPLAAAIGLDDLAPGSRFADRIAVAIRFALAPS